MANTPKTIVDVVGAVKDYITNSLADKVDKVIGKGLSTNDYDNTAKEIVDGVTSAIAKKWGNSSQRAAGAYNLLSNNATSGTYGGLTVTVNADKTISTTPGSNRQGFELVIFNDANNPIELESDCLFMLCVDMIGTVNAYATSDDGTVYYLSPRYGNKQIMPKNTKIVSVKMYFSNQFNDALTFKPIITPDLTATYDDYVPYSMTNRELTNEVHKLAALLGS